MDTTKIEDLKKQYELFCNEYAQKFCDKQEIVFDGWVADIVGGDAYCNDFCFNFYDIVWDINTQQPKGAIIDWYNECMENSETAINYYSYTKRQSCH